MLESQMQIVTVQLLRAIAAWAVVFHHVEQIFFRFSSDSFVGWLFGSKGAAGVELFFAISGFVMVVSTHDRQLTGGAFFFRRLARIVPAYWLCTGLMALVLLGIPSLQRWPLQVDMKHFALSLSFLSGFVPGHYFPVLTVGWSLNYEMIFYVLFALSLGLARHVRASMRPWILPIALTALQFYWWRLPGANMFTSKLMLIFLLGYCLGALFVRGHLPVAQWLGWSLLGIGLGLVVGARGSGFLGWGLGGAAILWAALCFERRLATRMWLARPGDWSYSTYLVHPIVLLLTKHMFDASGAGSVWLWIGASLLTILVLSWQSYDRFERPMARYLQQLARIPSARGTSANNEK